MRKRNVWRVLSLLLVSSMLLGVCTAAMEATCTKYSSTNGCRTHYWCSWGCAEHEYDVYNHTYIATRTSNGNGTHTTTNTCSSCGAIGATGTYTCTPGTYATYTQGSNYGHYRNTTCTVCGGPATSTFESCTLTSLPYTYTASYHTASSQCTLCGNTYSANYSHVAESFGPTSISSSQHKSGTRCSVCGYEISSTVSAHALTTTVTSTDASRHYLTQSCAACGFSGSTSEYHTSPLPCTTCGYGSSFAQLNAPTVSVEWVSSSEIQVTIGRPGNAADGSVEYRLEWKKANDASWSEYGGLYSSGTYTFIKPNLASNTAYSFRVYAKQSGMLDSAYSNVATEITDLGYYWPNPSQTKSFYAPSDLVATIQSQFAIWQAGSTAGSFVYNSTLSNPTLLVLWQDLSYNDSLGMTRLNSELSPETPAQRTAITSAWLKVDTSLAPSSTLTSAVILHELGHVFGLAHCHEIGESSCRSAGINCDNCVMNPYADRTSPRTALITFDQESYAMVYSNRSAYLPNSSSNQIDTQETTGQSNSLQSQAESASIQKSAIFTSWRPMTLEELAVRDQVAVATVISKSAPVAYATDEGLSVYSEVTLQVDQWISGSGATTITYHEEGGVAEGIILETPDYPKVSVGQQVLIFLNHGAVTVSPYSLLYVEGDSVSVPNTMIPSAGGGSLPGDGALDPDGSVPPSVQYPDFTLSEDTFTTVSLSDYLQAIQICLAQSGNGAVTE